MEIKYIQERTEKKDNNVSDFNKDLISFLEKKITDEIEQFNYKETPKSLLIKFLQKEVFATNNFKFKYLDLIKTKEKERSNKIIEFDDYKEVKKHFYLAINCLKEYNDFLIENIKRINKMKNKNRAGIKSIDLKSNVEDDINKIMLALKDANKKGYLQHDCKTVTNGYRLNVVLIFLYNEYKIIFDLNNVRKYLICPTTKKPYKKRYIETELCILHNEIRKT